MLLWYPLCPLFHLGTTFWAIGAFQGTLDEAVQARLSGGWTFVSKVAKMSSGRHWGERQHGRENYSTVNHKLLMTRIGSLAHSSQYFPSLGMTQQGKCMKHFAWRRRCAGHSRWLFCTTTICPWRLDLQHHCHYDNSHTSCLYLHSFVSLSVWNTIWIPNGA